VGEATMKKKTSVAKARRVERIRDPKEKLLHFKICEIPANELGRDKLWEEFRVVQCLRKAHRVIAEALNILPVVEIYPSKRDPSKKDFKMFPVPPAAWIEAAKKIKEAGNELRQADRRAEEIASLDDLILVEHPDGRVSLKITRDTRDKLAKHHRDLIEQDLKKGLGCTSAAELVTRHFPESKGASRAGHRLRFQNALNALNAVSKRR